MFSATALAAGISQHCAEAAPAVCLRFTDSAASTGLASLVTTASVTTTDTGNSYSASEELAKLEAMGPHPSQEEMASRLSVKHEQLVKDLTAELVLGDAQVAAMKTIVSACMSIAFGLTARRNPVTRFQSGSSERSCPAGRSPTMT